MVVFTAFPLSAPILKDGPTDSFFLVFLSKENKSKDGKQKRRQIEWGQSYMFKRSFLRFLEEAQPQKEYDEAIKI